MATSREEAQQQRMAERLRGAQRVYLADESFDLGIDIPDAEPEAAPLPAAQPPSPPAPEPQVLSPSRKRKRGDSRPLSSSQGQGDSGRPRSDRPSSDVYDLPDTSKETVGQSQTQEEGVEEEEEEPAAEPEPESETPRPRPRSPNAVPPGSSPTAQVLSSGSRNPRLPAPQAAEEIEESPANAPGSGRRRRIPGSSALASSARLHDALSSDGPLSSSPLVKKSRRRISEVSKPRSSLQQTIPASDDLAPEPSEPEDEEVEPVAEPEETLVSPEPEPEDEQEDRNEDQDEEAEEINAVEADTALGRSKRGRRGPREPSVELGEEEQEEPPEEEREEQEEQEEEEEEEDQPAPKRRRGMRSPAAQKQGGPKATKTAPATRRPQRSPTPSVISDHESESEPEADTSRISHPQAKPAKSAPKSKRGRKRKSDDSPARKQNKSGGGSAIDVAVQRFVNHKRRSVGGDQENVDELQLNIPYANYNNETVVDVFAQVCDEVIAVTQGQLEQLLMQAPDAAKRKEYKIKMQAIENYRHELGRRHLEHALYLNHWHSLKKRVRETQKERQALREDILRIRAEREQVAIRMDAIRAKHEEDQNETSFLLNTSSIMRDIDRVIEAGHEAPELPQKERKEAELANLELAVSQVSAQASSAGPGGGLLNQIKEFNAFLERTARALELR